MAYLALTLAIIALSYLFLYKNAFANIAFARIITLKVWVLLIPLLRSPEQ
jgi:hypothetical protein